MKKVLLVLSVLILLNACEKEVTIVGSWAHDSYVYNFKDDNTCYYDAAGTILSCTYETDGDKLSILYDGNTAPFETTYRIDGKTLHIVDSFGTDVEYERK